VVYACSLCTELKRRDKPYKDSPSGLRSVKVLGLAPKQACAFVE